jgi:hypothetical protein
LIEVGLIVKFVMLAVSTVSEPVIDAPLSVTTIFTGVSVPTTDVNTLKVAEFPTSTTDLSIATTWLFVERLAITPPGPPGPLRVMVPVVALPPRTRGGAKEMEIKFGGVKANFAVFEEGPIDAVIDTSVSVETP